MGGGRGETDLPTVLVAGGGESGSIRGEKTWCFSFFFYIIIIFFFFFLLFFFYIIIIIFFFFFC